MFASVYIYPSRNPSLLHQNAKCDTDFTKKKKKIERKRKRDDV